MAAEGPEMGPSILTPARAPNALPTVGKAKEAWAVCPMGVRQPTAPHGAARKPASSCWAKTRGAVVPAGSIREMLLASSFSGGTEPGPICGAQVPSRCLKTPS